MVSKESAASQRVVFPAVSSSLNFLRQFEGARAVAFLAPFVSAAEQDDNRVAALDEIHPLARTVVDPHLRHATADRLDVAGIAEREATVCQEADRDGSAHTGERPIATSLLVRRHRNQSSRASRWSGKPDHIQGTENTASLVGEVPPVRRDVR